MGVGVYVWVWVCVCGWRQVGLEVEEEGLLDDVYSEFDDFVTCSKTTVCKRHLTCAVYIKA